MSYNFDGAYKIKILLASLVCTIVADGVITRYLVFKGYASEGNPLLGSWVGEDTFLTLKAMGGLLAALYLWNIYRRYPRLAIYCSSLFLVVYTCIVFWNLHILL